MAKKITGRTSSFTQKIADRICERMSDGESLRDICKDAAMPDKKTVLRWVEAREDFRDQYARAREALVDHWAEEIVAEANNTAGDIGADGRGNSANVQRSKLKIDTLKWLMSKIAPRKYGEFNRQEVSGPNGGPQEHLKVSWQVKRIIVQPGEPVPHMRPYFHDDGRAKSPEEIAAYEAGERAEPLQLSHRPSAPRVPASLPSEQWEDDDTQPDGFV